MAKQCIAPDCQEEAVEFYVVREWDDDKLDPRYVHVKVGLCYEHDYDRNIYLEP